MRLWSLHPKYLDAQGLVALWREGLLARAVLRGNTRGYKHHPQLDRFTAHAQPRLAINAYLAGVHAEAEARGYSFDRTKIGPVKVVEPPKSKKDAVLVFTEIDVQGAKATVRYRYDVEGIRATVTLAKTPHGWELKNSRLVEH